MKEDHQDPMSKDIYEEAPKSPGLERPITIKKPTLPIKPTISPLLTRSGKEQDKPAIGVAGSSKKTSHQIVRPHDPSKSQAAAKRLAAVEKAVVNTAPPPTDRECIAGFGGSSNLAETAAEVK